MGGQRSWMVVAMAFVLFSAAIIAAITAFSLILPGSAVDTVWTLKPDAYVAFAQTRPLSGWMLALVGVLCVVSAVGLLRARRWGWVMAVGLFAINGLGDLASLVVWPGRRVDSLFGVLVALGFVGILVSGPVRRYCLHS